MYSRLSTIGTWRFPKPPAPTDRIRASTKNSALPPIITAFRRSPRRQAVMPASATKTSISTHADWPTSVHGLATPPKHRDRFAEKLNVPQLVTSR